MKGSGLTDKSEHLIHRRDVQRKLSKVVIFFAFIPSAHQTAEALTPDPVKGYTSNLTVHTPDT